MRCFNLKACKNVLIEHSLLPRLRGSSTNEGLLNFNRKFLFTANSQTIRNLDKNNKFDNNASSKQEVEEDVEMIPCEFCDELFPFENLIMHQVSTRFIKFD